MVDTFDTNAVLDYYDQALFKNFSCMAYFMEASIFYESGFKMTTLSVFDLKW